MLGMSVFVLFVVALVAVACFWILLRPDEYFTAHRAVTCPETRRPAEVKIDIRHRFRTLLRGIERLRLKSCSRWPERKACGQECLLQIDLNPAVLQDVLRTWYEGKRCALCEGALTEQDWRLGRFSGLDEKGYLVYAGEMPVRELPMALERYRPVCWACRSAHRAPRPAAVSFKGDRRARVEEFWTGE